MHYSQLFKEAFQNLNAQQQKAANHIDGPMLVIAGPGTGKTELLAIRVGCILKSNIDVHAYNILCLTFTDAGAYAMRSRLLKYIGPDAYQVGIYTYHSFCNQVIRENMEYFGDYRDLQPVSDLERVDIMRKIIDDLPPDHLLKRLKGDFYNDMYHLLNLFQTMKKENWTEEDFKAGLEKQKELLLDKDELYYTRKYTNPKTKETFQAGDLKKKAFDSEMAKYEKTYIASQLLKDYNAALKALERFDYEDMILWVIEKFEEHEELLARYQERFQYLLLDEYQDTNGSQNKIVFQIAEYWPRPNLFAVGDDDQSIYRFQGANMSNIDDFQKNYTPDIVVLDQNYRSAQSILDAASNVIQLNEKRMVNQHADLTKNLVESRTSHELPSPGPIVKRYRNPMHEEVGLLLEIERIMNDGARPGDIAVIYKEHKQVDGIVKYLSNKGVPLHIRRKVNVLELPPVIQVLNILRYIAGELKEPFSEERRLFEILHYRFFKVQPVDLAQLSILTSRRTDELTDDLSWRPVISDRDKLSTLPLKDPEAIYQAGILLDSWLKAAVNDTLQVLMEKIITSSGWLLEIIHGTDKKWMLEVMNTFMNLVKDESSRKTQYNLEAFLSDVDKMEFHNISIPLQQVIGNEEGINFVTAHGSKGLEFKHVFIVKVQKKTWVEKNINSRFKYPESMVPTSEKSDIEDDRRLFYVALTRAEDEVQVSFSDVDMDDKETDAAQFIYEMEVDVPDSYVDIDEGRMMEYAAIQLRSIEGKTDFIEKDLLNEILKDFKHSATSLNKYLRCPLTFYFENILRVPMARTPQMGYGNAVHHALEYYFDELTDTLPDGPIPPVEKLIDYFDQGMERYHSHFTQLEYDNYKLQGRNSLKEYYDHYNNSWLGVQAYKLEHVVDDVSYDGIPIKGKLDKLTILADSVNVIDYKTGTYKYEDLKPPVDDTDGGKYWRQLVFYKFLIDSDKKHNYRFSKGVMDFIENKDGKFNYKELEIFPEYETIVADQLKRTHEGIHAHKFPGCDDEKCKWCNFINDFSPLPSPMSDGEGGNEE